MRSLSLLNIGLVFEPFFSIYRTFSLKTSGFTIFYREAVANLYGNVSEIFHPLGDNFPEWL